MANIFNPVIPIATGLKNFLGFPGTHQTKDQEEWMRNTIMNKIRNTGDLKGGIHYGDYASPIKNPDGIGVSEIPYNSHASRWDGGLFGPARAYGTTLGLGDYSVPQQGGKVDWTGGTAYDFHSSDFAHNRFLKSIANVVDKGGLFGSGVPQHYTPDVTISPKDIQSIFGGGQMMHKGEPTYNQGMVNVEDYQTKSNRIEAAKQAKQNSILEAAKAKEQAILAQQQQQQQQQSSLPSMNTPSNQTKFGVNRSTQIKGGRGGRGNVAARRKSTSAPAFKSYGPPNMQRF